MNITGVSGGYSYSAQVSYTADFGAQTLTGGNDVAIYNFVAAVPEPTTLALLGALASAASGVAVLRKRKPHLFERS